MITKHNLYNWLITLSQPQIIRFVFFAFVLTSSVLRIASPPTLACDISCGGHVGG